MTESDLTAVVCEVVELQLGHTHVRIDDRLVEDLQADSFDVMNLAAVLEEEHDIVITESAAAAVKTVGELVALVEQLLHG